MQKTAASFGYVGSGHAGDGVTAAPVRTIVWLGSPLSGPVGKQGVWSASLQHHWLMPPFTSGSPPQETVQVPPNIAQASSRTWPGQGFEPERLDVSVVRGRVI